MNYNEKLQKLENEIDKSIKKLKKSGGKIGTMWGIFYSHIEEKFVFSDENNKTCCPLGAVAINLQPKFRNMNIFSASIAISKLFKIPLNSVGVFTYTFDTGLGNPKKSKITALALKMRKKYLKLI